MRDELRPLSTRDGREIYDMLQEIPPGERGFYNSVHGKSYEEFQEWLQKSEGVSKGIGLEDWMVPQTTYWLYANGFPVGYGKVRHALTDALRLSGGHIGYAVRPSMRGQGYGKRLLQLLLERTREMGVEDILVTINEDNIASRQVALANGGRLEKVENERNYYWFT